MPLRVLNSTKMSSEVPFSLTSPCQGSHYEQLGPFLDAERQYGFHETPSIIPMDVQDNADGVIPHLPLYRAIKAVTQLSYSCTRLGPQPWAEIRELYYCLDGMIVSECL